MKIERAFRMGLAEIAGRARLEVSKRLDRRADPGRTRLGGSIAVDVVDQCLAGMPPRFFAGAHDSRVPPLVRERFPDGARRVVAAAEQALGKRFDLLGYRQLSFGDPIDWHLDPVAGRRAPTAHWTRLDPLDAGLVGDHKVVWELNRHQWLVGLGQAYRLTADERYARAFVEAVGSWHRANPPGMGINWASSLEAAFRLISWFWALALFRESPALTGALRVTLVESIVRHARRIERYLSHYFSPNTHLTGEALGLFYAGTLLPLLPDSARWRRTGMEILVREADRQILPDGVYMEQSTCYQRYTAEIYLHFAILASRNGLAVPDRVGRRLERLLDVLVALRSPDGLLPQIGDADGGWLLPLEARRPGDGSGVFSTAAALLGRADYAWAAGGATADVPWLLGVEGAEGFDRLDARPPTEPASRLLPDGGYAVMRSGWDQGGDQVIFDVGPLGCHISGGHGHADLLGIQASFGGLSYIVDPGTYHYLPGDGWRGHYRGTAAHSTVEVDQVGQAEPQGPFGWRDRPRAHLIRWTSSPAADAAIAEHHAYGRLPDPVVHRRAVQLVKGRYCLVVDDLAGVAEHRISLRFQFAPMSVTADPTGWIRAGRGSARGLLLHAFATSPLKSTILEGETDPRQGWMASDYGRHQPAPVLVYTLTTILPVRIVTVLWPTDDLVAPPPGISALVEDGWLQGLVLDDGREIVRVDDLMGPRLKS
jgi:hypothetical protein